MKYLRKKELAAAMEAAKAAAVVVIEARRQLIQNSAVSSTETKNFAGDIVCAADKAASEAIIKILRNAFRRDGIVSEEQDECIAGSSGRRWIIDPIDGSAFFVSGTDDRIPCVMIALEGKDGQLLVSVILFPFTGDVYHAVAGHGAFLNGKRFSAPQGRRLSEIVVGMNPYSDSRYETSYFRCLWNELRATGGPMLIHHGPPNSAMGVWSVSPTEQFRLFGAHIHDFNPVIGKQCIWDIAPVSLLVKEAGGVFLNRLGETIDHRDPDFAVVAESRGIAEQILRLI